MQKRSELFFNFILLPIDFLAVTAAFILAYVIRIHPERLGLPFQAKPISNPLGIVLFLKIFLLIVPVWILIFALSGLYNMTSQRGRLEELGKTFVAVSGGVMFMILVDFASRQPIFPAKSIPIWGYALSLLLVAVGRQVVRAVQRYLFTFGIGLHQVFLVGSGEIAQRLADDMTDPRSGFRVVGVIDSARNVQKRLPGLKVYDSAQSAMQAMKRREVDEIIQADSALEQEDVLELMNFAAQHHLSYRFVPNQFGLMAMHSTVRVVSGYPVVEVRQTPLEGWGRIVKRGFDLVGAGLGLIVLSPLMLLIALAVKLTDPGPVLYRQRRLSRWGRPIKILKFRTMLAKYCTGPDFGGRSNEEVFQALGRPELFVEFSKENKLANDPRISRVGRFLRRTSLDELPQLWNVLVGELSLVGPRPMLEDELGRYGESLAAVLALRCGVTGLWQTSGRTDIGFDGRVKMDLYYVENWSLLMDLRILARTVIKMFTRQGAY